jgi:hypothetical protein
MHVQNYDHSLFVFVVIAVFFLDYRNPSYLPRYDDKHNGNNDDNSELTFSLIFFDLLDTSDLPGFNDEYNNNFQQLFSHSLQFHF